MAFTQPPLCYAKDALEPVLSGEQIEFHYGKHHSAYFKNLNGLVEGKPEAGMSLGELTIKATGPIFNNAAQALNHNIYWDSLSPGGGGEPTGDLAAAIARDFGSFEAFKNAMTDAAVKVFGSGWGWLAANKQGKIEVMGLSNADNPLRHDAEPLLTIDVWEHAYYIDYRNERPRYVEALWKIINWTYAAECYARAKE
jgi:Fe-Mn family superoxide dismutase